MFSFQQISRWLSFSADVLTVEDWLANREVFGPVEKPSDADIEMEKAFFLEKERQNDGGEKGTYEQGVLFLICVKGKARGGACLVEWTVGKEKIKRSMVSSSLLLNVPIDGEVKLKVRCRNGFKIAGKNEYSWQGKGKAKVMIESVTK